MKNMDELYPSAQTPEERQKQDDELVKIQERHLPHLPRVRIATITSSLFFLAQAYVSSSPNFFQFAGSMDGLASVSAGILFGLVLFGLIFWGYRSVATVFYAYGVTMRFFALAYTLLGGILLGCAISLVVNQQLLAFVVPLTACHFIGVLCVLFLTFRYKK